MSVLRFDHWRDVRPEQWPLKFFDPKEVADSRRGSIVLDLEFGMKLDRIREEHGSPIQVNSWYRTQEHDWEIGGKGNHVSGAAADVVPRNGDWYGLAALAFKHGMLGIGFNPPSFLHFDMNRDYERQGKRPAIWKYS